MTNGTFGTPLAGEYFKTKWSGSSLKALYDKSRTMPPAAPGSLPADTYTTVLTYILEVNGSKPGETPLPPGAEALAPLTVP
jgi:hypothetical protein